MGLFNKKEKTSEEKLADEIWEEIKLLLSDTADKIELFRIVEKTCANGASCDEIRRVYEENLPNYKMKPNDEIERLMAVNTTPLTQKEKIKGIGCLAIIAAFAAIIVGLFFLPRELKYDEVTAVGGLNFHVPQGYELEDSHADDIFAYQKYVQWKRARNKSTYSTTYYFEIYVSDNMTIDQLLSYLKFDDGWKINRDIAYGEYNGIRVDIIVMPFGNTSPQWFLFEKGGKAVAIYIDNERIFEDGILKIIS